MGDPATERQRRFWDRAAPGYDRQMALLERIWFTGGREWIGERATGRVLEVAIGTGLNLQHYSPEVTVTGVELSAQMLARARDRIARGTTPRRTTLLEGDAERLPVADASYETVVCGLSLCSIPDPARARAEMRRALVPGGHLILVDHVGSTWPPIYAAQWLLERVTIRVAGEHFTRRQRPRVEAAGFEVVEAERRRAGTIERLRARRPAAG